jgi:DNA-directed RNA polymerase specialized sigma24 family protein
VIAVMRQVDDLDLVEDPGSSYGWLRSIAEGVLVDNRRHSLALRRDTRRTILLPSELRDCRQSEPLLNLYAAEIRERLRDGLDAQAARILNLLEEGATTREIAVLAGVSLRSIQRIIERSRLIFESDMESC